MLSSENMYRIVSNTLNIPIDDMFVVGKRDNNTKRSFLFISKLLGKHLAVKPSTVKDTGARLASLYSDDGHRVLVIGFCETATALGLSVASAINGADYIATTREPVIGLRQILSFEESHSHAPSHSMFSDSICLYDYDEVVLVDDEITTGHSMLHLIEQLVGQSSIRRFSVLTILDWRRNADRQAFNDFALRHGVRIHVHALVTGEITEEDHVVYHNKPITMVENDIPSKATSVFPRRMVMTTDGPIPYFVHSGRFGISHDEIEQIETLSQRAANRIAEDLQGNTVLVLGHGENIYIPSRVAAKLQEAGFSVMFKTTSRTPIFVDEQIIKDAETFMDRGVRYHFYNREEAEEFDNVILLADTPFYAHLCNKLRIYDL